MSAISDSEDTLLEFPSGPIDEQEHLLKRLVELAIRMWEDLAAKAKQLAEQ